jgi:hypothetical protein
VASNPLQVAAAAYANHGLARETQRQRVGYRHDLHCANVDETLDALPDGSLGQPDGLADRCIRSPAVLLELFDNLLGQAVEHDLAVRLAAGRLAAVPSARGERRYRRVRHV